jgi:hypothetical protein
MAVSFLQTPEFATRYHFSDSGRPGGTVSRAFRDHPAGAAATRKPKPSLAIDGAWREAAAQIGPGKFRQEKRKLRLLGSARQKNRDDGKAALDELREEGAHLSVFPGPEPIVADENRTGAGGLDDLFQLLLPRLAGKQVADPPAPAPGSDAGQEGRAGVTSEQLEPKGRCPGPYARGPHPP